MDTTTLLLTVAKVPCRSRLRRQISVTERTRYLRALRIESFVAIQPGTGEDTGWCEVASRNSFFRALYRESTNKWERTWTIYSGGSQQNGNDEIPATSAWDTTKNSAEPIANGAGFPVYARASCEQDLRVESPATGTKTINIGILGEVIPEH